MRTQLKSATATLTGLTALALFAACGSGPETTSTPVPTWRIGLEAPLSGDQAILGKGMLEGAQLAAAQINATGGVLGRNIDVVAIDDAADPDTGVRAANSALASGLHGVVGPYNSGVGAKTLPLYIDAGVVPIRLTSDNSTDGEGFTLQPMSNQIAPVTSKALSTYYKAKAVGILYDSTQNYTVSTSNTVKDQLTEAGVTVTSYLAIKPGKASYSDALQEVLAKKPDVIYSAVYYPEGAKVAKELSAQSQPSRCLLDYASYDKGYVSDAGTAAKACEVVGVPAPGDFPSSESYVSAFEEKFSSAPGTWSPYTFDSLKFLADGASAAGTFDAAALTKKLSTVAGWKGWTGSVTIEPATGNRNPATVVVTTVNDQGEFHNDSSWAKAVGAPY